jgi:cyclic pyranopterin phosphate synthase
MVDVSSKPATARRAVAEAFVAVSPETLSLVIDGGGSKGDVLSVAELAGVMGAKRTSELIPLCHPLPLTDLLVTVTPDRAAGGLRVRAEAATVGPTGVEMEALTAAAVASLTVYDMVKGVERSVEIRELRLVSKSGGKSGDWERPADARGFEPRREQSPHIELEICASFAADLISNARDLPGCAEQPGHDTVMGTVRVALLQGER